MSIHRRAFSFTACPHMQPIAPQLVSKRLCKHAQLRLSAQKKVGVSSDPKPIKQRRAKALDSAETDTQLHPVQEMGASSDPKPV